MSRSFLIAPEALLATPAAALIASLPAAIRLTGDQIGMFEGWIAVAGLLCPLLAVGIAAGRSARGVMKTIVGDSGTRLLMGAAVWTLLSLPASAFFGAFLKANTHHRGLAGATYAVGALIIYVAAALVARRVSAVVLSWLRRPAGRTAVTAVLCAAALLWVVASVAVALASGAKSEPETASRIPALLVDGSLAVAILLLATIVEVPRGRSSEVLWIGAGAVAFLGLVGLALTVRSPAIQRGLPIRAPLAATVGRAFGLADDAP